jgi:hypothetical protein
MASKTNICNLALSHCGVSTFIANVDTDNLKEARVCKLWWNAALDFLLRDIDWNFNRHYLNLALLGGIVPSHWLYKYAYPSNCLAIRAIMPPNVRFPTIKQRVLYEVAAEEVSEDLENIKVIYTDQVNAVARISNFVVDVGLLDATATLAQSYLLASFIATPLTIKPAIAESNRRAYISIRDQAIANNFKEGEDGPEPEDEFERVRNG